MVTPPLDEPSAQIVPLNALDTGLSSGTPSTGAAEPDGRLLAFAGGFLDVEM